MNLSRYAESLGKPAVTAEAGHAGTTDADDVGVLIEGCRNVMRHLKMLPGGALPIEHPLWFSRALVVSGDRDGVFYPLALPESYVSQGMPIGYITDYFNQVERVNDTDAAAGKSPVDGLSVLQVRIHAGGIVDKPGTEVARRVVGVFVGAGDFVSGGERGHDQAEADHGAAMLHEIIGIGHAVALDVGAVGVGGVGPPVVALGKKVVGAAGAAGRTGRGHGDGLFGEVAIRGLQDAGALDGDEVELRG
jgi:hypothetical protein